jgi:hypothetical protein
MLKSSADPDLVSISVTVYRFLVAFYPAQFKRDYGQSMTQVFRDCCRKAYSQAGLPGMGSLWAITLIDWIKTLIEEQVNQQTEMTLAKWVRLSGWALVLAAVALLLTFLPEAGDISSRISPTFGGSGAAAQIQRVAVLARALPLPLAILLITIGLLGLSVRYGEMAGRAAKAALILGVSGGVLSLVSFGLMLLGLVDGRPAVNIAMGIMFSGLFIFGLAALRRKPMKRGNGLPVLAGVWWPVLVIQAYVFPQLTRSFMPEVPRGLSFSIFAIMSFFLAWLGYVVQAEAAPTGSSRIPERIVVKIMNNHADTPQFTWLSFGLLVGVTILGYLFAGFLHMPGGGPPLAISLRSLDLGAGLVGFVFGAVTGLVAGGLQWIVLKMWLPKARGWILLNALAFGLVHALNDAGLFNSLPSSLSLMVDGLIIGAAQAFALRKALNRSYIWPVVLSTAWLLGFVWAYAFENAIEKNPLLSLWVAYGGAGLIIGGIMGIFIKYLHPKGKEQDG